MNRSNRLGRRVATVVTLGTALLAWQLVSAQRPAQQGKMYGMQEEAEGLPLLAKMNFYSGAPNTHVMAAGPKTSLILTAGVTVDRLVPLALGVPKDQVEYTFDTEKFGAYHVYIKTVDDRPETSRAILKILLTNLAGLTMEKEGGGKWKVSRSGEGATAADRR